MRMEFDLALDAERASRAASALRARGRRAVRDAVADVATRARASASRSSSRARTTACSTCCGAGAAASWSATSRWSRPTTADLREDVEAFGLPLRHVPVAPEREGRGRGSACSSCSRRRVDLVVLARYMQILTGDFLDELGVPVINIHHSFLPAFAGAGPTRRPRSAA